MQALGRSLQLKMKKTIYISIILLVSLQLNGQKQVPQKTDTIFEAIDSIKEETVKLNDKVVLLVKENGALEKRLENNEIVIKELKSKVDIYQSTLETDDIIFGGISTYFTIIAILLSIIVIAIPIINYFLVLKPNKQTLDKVEKLESEVLTKIEKNFENYLNNLEKTKSKKIIAMLNDRANLSKVVNYFFLKEADFLEDEDIAIVIKFLEENDDIEEMNKITLHSIVSNHTSILSEKYYKSIFEKEDKINQKYAIDYLIENNLPSHIDYIETVIKASDEGHELLTNFFFHIKQKFLGNFKDKKSPEKMELGQEYTKLLFNSDKILESIKGTELPKGMLSDSRININVINQDKFIRETEYYKTFLKKIDRI